MGSVYAETTVSGQSQVIEYLGRYTHKITISNHRIQSIESGKVSFTYKRLRRWCPEDNDFLWSALNFFFYVDSHAYITSSLQN